MSTILKALRRLEDEKQAAAARPLRDEVVAVRPGEPLSRRRGRALGPALGAGAVLALLGGAWALDLPARWLRGAGEPQVAAAPPPAAVAPAAEPAPASPGAEPEAVSAAREPFAVDASADARRFQSPRAEAVAVAAEPAPAAPERAPAPRREAAPPTPPRVAAAAPAPAVEPLPRPVVAPTLPRVVVESTVWHPDAARRTARVSLEGRDAPLELRQGDAVGSLVVREIEPGGVLFQLGDIELRRAVGEKP